MSVIAAQMHQMLLNEIALGGSEPEIVKRYTSAANSLVPPPNIAIRAGFIHQKPYLLFCAPGGFPTTLCGKHRCELGDVMYVFKEKVAPTAPPHYVSVAFLQAKLGTNAWDVEPHQLEVARSIRTLPFTFGNSVFAAGQIAPIPYSGLAVSHLFYYLLLGTRPRVRALAYDAARVIACSPGPCVRFSLRQTEHLPCKSGAPCCRKCDSHEQFLLAMTSRAAGEPKTGSLAQVVDLIYKRIGWAADPPEEFEGYFLEEGERPGFGIIEITAIRPARD
jgi:hypothetical protein